MAATVIRTFDLYNTTFYWQGYSIPSYSVELGVAQASYLVNWSPNIIGSQIDFFNSLAGITNTNNKVFTLSTTLENLSYLWKKYWWDEAMYYSHPLALSAIKLGAPSYYQPFSESVGSLYYLSRFNNLQNTQTVIYNPLLLSRLPPGVSDSINSFYLSATNFFNTNVQKIGPTGTDIAPNNGSLAMANTDLTRRITSNLSLTAAVNVLYPGLSSFLPYNTIVQGNLITPYYWSVSANVEGTTINVGINNTSTQAKIKPQTNTLIAT